MKTKDIKQIEFNKSFFLGKVIYIANATNFIEVKVDLLAYSQSNKNKILINKCYIVEKNNWITEIKESGYFKDSWKYFLIEKDAKKYYTEEKINLLTADIKKIVLEINELKNSNI